MEGVLGILRDMQTERDQLARDLERLDAVVSADQDYASLVADALDEIRHLEERIASAPPAEVRDMLGRWVERVTLNFRAEPWADGRQRHILADVEIVFTSEAGKLLPSVRRRRTSHVHVHR
jgi:hypothetical protein